jgi:UDP-N-acetylglucosamine 3-dehydrogenase
MKAIVVGMGAMGQRHYASLARNSQVHEIVTVDPNPNIQAQYLSLGDALADHKIDLGIVASPTSYHTDTSCTLLALSIPVLIEKPIASSVEEAQTITTVANQTNTCVAVGHIERQNPAIQALMEDMKETPCTVTLKRSSPYPARIKDVGVALDLSIHDVDLARYITGAEIVGTTSTLQRVRNSCEDIAMYLLELDNGGTALVHTSWLSPFRERRAEIVTPTAVYDIDMLRHQASKYTNTVDVSYGVTGLFVRRQDQLDSQLSRFIDYIQTGNATNLCLLEDGIKALTVVEESLNESMH